jgi:hypothetical protein
MHSRSIFSRYSSRRPGHFSDLLLNHGDKLSSVLNERFARALEVSTPTSSSRRSGSKPPLSSSSPGGTNIDDLLKMVSRDLPIIEGAEEVGTVSEDEKRESGRETEVEGKEWPRISVGTDPIDAEARVLTHADVQVETGLHGSEEAIGRDEERLDQGDGSRPAADLPEVEPAPRGSDRTEEEEEETEQSAKRAISANSSGAGPASPVEAFPQANFGGFAPRGPDPLEQQEESEQIAPRISSSKRAISANSSGAGPASPVEAFPRATFAGLSPRGPDPTEDVGKGRSLSDASADGNRTLSSNSPGAGSGTGASQSLEAFPSASFSRFAPRGPDQAEEEEEEEQEHSMGLNSVAGSVIGPTFTDLESPVSLSPEPFPPQPSEGPTGSARPQNTMGSATSVLQEKSGDEEQASISADTSSDSLSTCTANDAAPSETVDSEEKRPVPSAYVPHISASDRAFLAAPHTTNLILQHILFSMLGIEK